MPQLYTCAPDEPWVKALRPWQRDTLAWSSIVFVCSLYYILPAAIFAALYAAWTGYARSAAASLALMIALSVAPMNEWIAARKFCQVYYGIFRVRHNLSPRYISALCGDWVRGERYILGMHPHGVVPIQAFLWAAYADQYLRSPEHGTLYGFGGMATVVTRLPVLRSILGWLSGLGASYSTLKRGLTGRVFARPPTGHNIYMLPGGLAEIFTARPGSHTIVWRRRRGLVRLALETGARLVPVYVFGGPA
jgi:hypothetical protein